MVRDFSGPVFAAITTLSVRALARVPQKLWLQELYVEGPYVHSIGLWIAMADLDTLRVISLSDKGRRGTAMPCKVTQRFGAGMSTFQQPSDMLL